MKFRFCGDGDCPDWILAEIHSTLSVLSSIKLRILTQIVAKSLLEEEINEEKLKEIFSTNPNPIVTAKSAISCLRYLLISASRHNTENTVFNTELQQLGLPKEHSAAVCRIYGEFFNQIQNNLAKKQFNINNLEKIVWRRRNDALDGGDSEHPGGDWGQFDFVIRNEVVDGIKIDENVHTVSIYKSDLDILINELKTVRNIMEKYENDK